MNTTHLKALIRKDFTNLNRRRTFCVLFLAFPPLLSWLANYVFTDALELDANTVNGSLIMRKFKHQSFDVLGPLGAPLSSVGNSTKSGKMPFAPNDYFPQVRQGDDDGPGCTRILIAAGDDDVRAKAKLYAENFMLGPNEALKIKREPKDIEEDDKVKVYTFATRAEMDEFAKVNETQNCLGLNFIKVDTAKFDYEVMFSFI